MLLEVQQQDGIQPAAYAPDAELLHRQTGDHVDHVSALRLVPRRELGIGQAQEPFQRGRVERIQVILSRTLVTVLNDVRDNAATLLPPSRDVRQQVAHGCIPLFSEEGCLLLRREIPECPWVALPFIQGPQKKLLREVGHREVLARCLCYTDAVPFYLLLEASPECPQDATP